MKIALIGNQNSGKTTLFNLLTGSNQKVGNWPGVTIEQKTGIIKGTKDTLIDLPGVYSLSPYTAEESVSRNYIFNEKPELIINIIDATNIERSLYLTTMLLELDCDVIIALNMTDILQKKGYEINVDALSSNLHTTVVTISALKRTGIDELITHIKQRDYLTNNHNHIFTEDIETTVNEILSHIHMPHERFSAIKMLENDPQIGVSHIREIEDLRENIEKIHGMDIEQVIADERYNYISKIKNDCLKKHEVKESITKKIDRIVLNRWLAIPVFILIMGIVYLLSVGLVGSFLTKLISSLFTGNETIIGLSGWLNNIMTDAGASNWAISLICDGVIAGVGSVLSFLPQIIVLFFLISVLETTGYMSRIAYFFDKIFHRFGLSGKSLIPFILGSGCSVPGIMTSRIVEDDKERKITIALTPMIPCSAKLPIISALSVFLVGNNPLLSFVIAFSTYVFAILLILLYAFILNKIVLKGDSTSFLSELPDYKFPSMKYVLRDVFEKTASFITRAGTIILASSIILWVLLHFTWTFRYLQANEISSSILADIGKTFSWFFIPMTGNLYKENTWALAVSAIQGLVAKEQVVSCMEVIGSNQFVIFQEYPITALAFMVFILYSIPCFGSISATKKETGSWIKTLGICLFQLLTAWAISSLIGGIGVALASI